MNFLFSLSTKWTPVWRENTSVRFYSQRCTGSLCLCLNGTWLLAISARFTGPRNIYKQSPFMKLLKYAFIHSVSFWFCLCRPPRLTTWSNLCSSPLCYWQVKKKQKTQTLRCSNGFWTPLTTVSGEKNKTKSHCDWFETGGIPGTFSRTVTGEAEPGWARRPETGAAAFPSDDAFTDSSERGAARRSRTQCRGNIFRVVVTSRCSFDLERRGRLLLFFPSHNRLVVWLLPEPASLWIWFGILLGFKEAGAKH